MQEKAKELVVRYFNEHRDVTDSEKLSKTMFMLYGSAKHYKILRYF